MRANKCSSYPKLFNPDESSNTRHIPSYSTRMRVLTLAISRVIQPRRE
jgi:hypothetical protein